jgi:hypothetical protein
MNIEVKHPCSLAEIGPHDLVVSPDDSFAIALLLEHGMGLLTPDQAKVQVGINAADALFDTATHYCMVRHHFGFTDPKENGYCATMLPKSLMNRIEAGEFFAAAIHETRVAGTPLIETPLPAY